MLFCLVCCSGNKTEIVDNIETSSSYPTVRTLNVVTHVTDSGMLRFKVVAPEWLVFDKKEDPYWYFPKGVTFEKFTATFDVDAKIQADTAYYFEKRKVWQLIGNVDVTNQNNENFKTELLFWDQNSSRVYSDSFIRIQRPERIIEGIGFESNDQMTQYVIRKPKGEFMIIDKPAPQDSVSTDSLAVEPQL